MAKKLAVRVDDRLIHGQVVTQWVNVFKAQHIVVIDNNVAKDKMQKSVLKFPGKRGVLRGDHHRTNGDHQRQKADL